jgi:CO/xanthine dehydrogenase Mo-binding subunit
MRLCAQERWTPHDALTIIDGEIKRKDRQAGPSITLAEIAASVAQLRVDRETGEVTIERFLVAYDIGRAVNPMMVEGQIAGGFARGLGGALYGSPLSVTFADHLMPTSCEVAHADVLLRKIRLS